MRGLKPEKANASSACAYGGYDLLMPAQTGQDMICGSRRCAGVQCLRQCHAPFVLRQCSADIFLRQQRQFPFQPCGNQGADSYNYRTLGQWPLCKTAALRRCRGFQYRFLQAVTTQLPMPSQSFWKQFFFLQKQSGRTGFLSSSPAH